MDQTDHPLRWYALRTKSRHEKIVRGQLANQGIEPLLPTVKRLSQWKDRKKEIEVPLFSGYCFVRFTSEQKLPVLKTIGVVDIVGASNCPEPIPDEEIAAIRTLMTSVLPYDPHPYLHERWRLMWRSLSPSDPQKRTVHDGGTRALDAVLFFI
jgi:transcriptional antiterminator NusG